MVDIVEDTFEYTKNFCAFFEAEGGNVDLYIEKLKKEGLLDENDPNT